MYILLTFLSGHVTHEFYKKGRYDNKCRNFKKEKEFAIFCTKF